ncbi:MAG: exodeoxyribonuclease V subunit gamma, partial [Solirubrobacteraceae bacterium]
PACTRLGEEPALVALPEHFAVFGLTRLPPIYLEVFKALSARRDVHLMLLHPSPVLWQQTAHAASSGNRLLASWGQDAQGLKDLLSQAGADADVHHRLEPSAELPANRPPTVTPSGERPGPPAPARGYAQVRPASLLARLQADIRADRRAPGPPPHDGAPEQRMLLAPDDRSVAVHACHGLARQVEVVREAILHRLAEDPTLEPRDVIVMCPDIEVFAPLIEATFGHTPDAVGVGDEPPAMRVSLADRSLRATTAILSLLARLLELASSRVSASELIDLAGSAPVRARFGFDDDELTRAREWIAQAGIHWGIDAAHRTRYGLGEVDAGTWAAGLRRLLLGVALAPEPDALIDGVLPATEIQSSEIDLLGRLCELTDRVTTAIDSFNRTQTLKEWTEAIITAVEQLTLTAPADAWQRQQLDEILAGTLASAHGSSAKLALGEIRTILAGHLEGRPTRANFRTGQLTFCTMAPMRSVPHRVICLLGLDDGAFPRQAARDGDNLLLTVPRPGDRNPRSEDRQLLLDALLAAGDALIIAYSGHDEHTNAPLPAAVPVGELLDTIDATARPTPFATPTEPLRGAGVDGLAAKRHAETALARAREQIVTYHPLQSFDPRNFVSDGLPFATASAGPWSFDRAALEGARALRSARGPQPPFLPAPLSAHQASVVTLEELISFLTHPVRAFLRQRLGIAVSDEEKLVDNALPIQLDALSRWAIATRMLEARLAGTPGRTVALAEIARGALPPGALAKPVIDALWPEIEAIVAACQPFTGGLPPQTLATNLTLPDGTRLTGSVAGVHGHVCVSASYTRMKPALRLAAWVRMLAVSAAHPEIPTQSVTVARRSDQGVAISRIAQLGGTAQLRAQTALQELTMLVKLRAAGMRDPLPLPCGSGHAYAQARLQTGEDAVAAADKVWRSRWGYVGEDADREYRLVRVTELDYDRLDRLAIPVWRPLLRREVLQ